MRSDAIGSRTMADMPLLARYEHAKSTTSKSVLIQACLICKASDEESKFG